MPPSSPAPPSTEPPQTSPGPRPEKAPRVGRTYHLHLPFLLFCGVSLLIAIGAFNSNNNLLFWLFALALSMLMVSGVISGQMLMAVRVERERVESVAEGQRLFIRYRVTNKNRLIPVFSLSITEEPATPRAAHPTGRPPSPLDHPEGFVAHVPARATIAAESTCTPHGRGVFPLATIRITSEFPFGIVRKSLTFLSPASVIIHPAQAPIDRQLLRDLSARSVRHERASRVQSPGLGDQFLALREYSPGDSPRQIAWRASSRRGDRGPGGSETSQLLIRQNAAGASPTAFLVVDLSGAADAHAYELAIRQAAGVAHAALTSPTTRDGQPFRLGLWVRSSGVVLPPASGGGRLLQILDTLALIPTFADQAQTTSPPLTNAPAGLSRAALVLVSCAAPPRLTTPADLASFETPPGLLR